MQLQMMLIVPRPSGVEVHPCLSSLFVVVEETILIFVATDLYNVVETFL